MAFIQWKNYKKHYILFKNMKHLYFLLRNFLTDSRFPLLQIWLLSTRSKDKAFKKQFYPVLTFVASSVLFLTYCFEIMC